jgi:hypothetical protein
MQRVLIVAIVVLSLNVLVAITGVGSASLKTTPVQVISKVSYVDVLGPEQSVSAGSEGESVAKCGAGYDVVSGGYHASGSYLLTPPSVVTSYPLGNTGWTIRLLDPKAGGSVSFDAYALCEKPTYTSVQGA